MGVPRKGFLILKRDPRQVPVLFLPSSLWIVPYELEDLLQTSLWERAKATMTGLAKQKAEEKMGLMVSLS